MKDHSLSPPSKKATAPVEIQGLLVFQNTDIVSIAIHIQVFYNVTHEITIPCNKTDNSTNKSKF